MRVSDLALDGLLEFHRDGGILRFAGQRVLLLDTVTLGLLRKELIETLGLEVARGVMTRFGYAHGWRTAETLERALPWTSVEEWRQAGGRLHRLQGMVTFEPVPERERGEPPAFAEAIWRDSYEVEQHLLHFGEADESVCWSLTGFASGYLSRAFGRPIFCVETHCCGRGDPLCRMRGDAREYFVDHGLEHQLAYYEQREGEGALVRVRESVIELERRLRVRRRELADNDASGELERGRLVARSPVMRSVVELARRVAPVDSTVLITGPTGVGKQRLARYIHEHSSRAGGPFIAINCGALPEQLLDSELFGHLEGSFGGATRDRIGLFEAAHTGTLLLDEIAELAPATQTRLLRILQEREVQRLGERSSRPSDVRLLAATHRDLATEVTLGHFREDLFDRLRVIEIQIPPLRERPEDVIPLARELLAGTVERLGRSITGFSPAACEKLLAHDWPGNIRELQSAIERAVACAPGSVIEPQDLSKPGSHAHADSGAQLCARTADHRRLDMSLAAVEREHILAIVDACGGNKAEAARRLGIGTATLFRKLKRYRG